MPRIICTLENASTEINGIKFVPHEDGLSLISEADVSESHASIFLSIPGYVVHETGAAGQSDPAATDAQKASAPKKETAAERKARLKAEEAAAAAAAPAPAAEPAPVADPEPAPVEEPAPAAEEAPAAEQGDNGETPVF